MMASELLVRNTTKSQLEERRKVCYDIECWEPKNDSEVCIKGPEIVKVLGSSAQSSQDNQTQIIHNRFFETWGTATLLGLYWAIALSLCFQCVSRSSILQNCHVQKVLLSTSLKSFLKSGNTIHIFHQMGNLQTQLCSVCFVPMSFWENHSFCKIWQTPTFITNSIVSCILLIILKTRSQCL